MPFENPLASLEIIHRSCVFGLVFWPWTVQRWTLPVTRCGVELVQHQEFWLVQPLDQALAIIWNADI
jgi:hypothetical protein